MYGFLSSVDLGVEFPGHVMFTFYGPTLTVPTKQLFKVNRKPILPAEEEIANNTRARSAKLRVAEKKEIPGQAGNDEGKTRNDEGRNRK